MVHIVGNYKNIAKTLISTSMIKLLCSYNLEAAEFGKGINYELINVLNSCFAKGEQCLIDAFEHKRLIEEFYTCIHEVIM